MRPLAPDASPRTAMIGVASVLASAIFGLVVVAGVSRLFDRSAVPAAAIRPTAPPAPRLEIAGGSDLAQVGARAAAKLNAYGWVDSGHTLTRIPLDRAMAITAERGWSDPEPAR